MFPYKNDRHIQIVAVLKKLFVLYKADTKHEQEWLMQTLKKSKYSVVAMAIAF